MKPRNRFSDLKTAFSAAVVAGLCQWAAMPAAEATEADYIKDLAVTQLPIATIPAAPEPAAGSAGQGLAINTVLIGRTADT